MTRRRWIADEVSGDRAALVGAHAAHLARVLRARVGQQFDIAAGNRLRMGTVTGVADDRVEFELGEDLPVRAAPQITLLLALFKFDRLEWAIEKATELGAARIVPVIARRTEAHLAKAAQTRVERWRRIAKEAAEQSRRIAAPEIADPAKLKDVFKTEAALRIVLSESEERMTLKDVLASGPSAVALAIGPEGGWTDDELTGFAEAGWVAASLGGSILRAETAAVAALAICASELS
jgi:16S rRNA (uracil1498-N3)-methyltransferase